MRRLCALALLAALGAAFVVSEVHAQAFVIPQWYNPATNSRVTIQPGETSALPTNEQSKDRNYGTIQTLLSSVNLNAGNAVSNSVDPVPLMSFSRGELLVAFAAATAADSDSVNILVTLTKKTSAASGVKYGQGVMPWGPDSLSSGNVHSQSTAVTGVWNVSMPKTLPTYYITRNSLQYLSVSGSISANPIHFPLWMYRLGATPSGIAINLADAVGPLIPGWYLEITVANLHPRKNLTGVQVDFVPRVW